MSACRSCHQPIEWGEFASGNRAPFDVDEQVTKEGETRWVLERDALGLDPSSPLQARRAKVGERGVVSHFSSCPNADQHRRASPL